MTQSNLKELSSFLSSLSVKDWGIASIVGLHPLSEEFPIALSILTPYSPDCETYTENEFHNTLRKVSAQTDIISAKTSDFFKSKGINHCLVPQGGQDPETLLALFPHKLAAVRAGLGWIGKNSLLITKRYGPRVRLATLLINWNIPYNEPITSSTCGTCELCKTACPYDCIK